MKSRCMKRSLFLLLIVIVLSGCSTKSASYYYKEGIEAFNDSDYLKAEENFIKAIEKNEYRAEYYIDYGMTLIMLEDYNQALSMFDRAILDKDNEIVRKNNKLAMRGKGILYYKSYDYINALEQFDKALGISELSELNLDILYYKASSEEKLGLYEKALESYTKILGEEDKDANTYSKRGNINTKLKRYEEALLDYDKAIMLDSENYDYYFGKYFLLLESGDSQGANKVLEDAANLKMETVEDEYNLGKIYYYQEKYDMAEIQLSEAFRNGFTSAYYYLGSICEKQGDYEAAVYNYRMYLEDSNNEKSAALFNQMGLSYMKLEKYTDALEAIQNGLKLNDIALDQSLRRNEIICLEHLARYDEAYKLARDYTSDYPNDEEAKRELTYIKSRVE